MKSFAILAAGAALVAMPAFAQTADPIAEVEAQEERTGRVAKQIWDYAELGYLETRSSGLLIDELQKEGFSIRPGVADIPTAFVAEWGEGGPVIGLLAEFDALPGITQSAAPTRDPVAEKHAGHACGHNLFGAGSLNAAIAKLTGGHLPLVGVGGISSPEDAYAKIKAGAHAIQLYSALAYQGLRLVDDIARGLDRMLAADGHDHISTAIGTETENWL